MTAPDQSPPGASDGALPGATAPGVFTADPVPSAAAGIEANVQRGKHALKAANVVPIAFAILPDDACTGNRHGLCLRCARLYARGHHIHPAARRNADGVSECVNWLEHESTVRPI